MSLGIIIQARRGSKRLPNKVLLKLGKNYFRTRNRKG